LLKLLCEVTEGLKLKQNNVSAIMLRGFSRNAFTVVNEENEMGDKQNSDRKSAKY
jgi:hypothetical protein